MRYPVALIPEHDGRYSVVFPDLPGCNTCGEDQADALAMARDAVDGWLEAMAENGLSIADPTPIESHVRRDPQTFRNAMWVFIDVRTPQATV
ncbi:MAG: type II toxin-antitoxin system HicB family antitoxin [Phycisphaeraceae bacterium]|nr:type II toxin-antitoxin system HicB family antitoxin [Phycisphaeraceae bacterium]